MLKNKKSLFSLLSIAVMGLQVGLSVAVNYASADNTQQILDLYTGNSVLNSMFKDYQQSLISGKNTEKLQKLYLEKNNLATLKTLSDDFKDDILKNSFSSVGRIKLKDSIQGADKQVKGLKMLVGSMKKQSDYKFLVSTTLDYEKLKELFGFFDNVKIELLNEGTDGKKVYQVSFPFTGRLSKILGTGIEAGDLPTQLFSGVSVIKPMLVEGFISTGDYLKGESLTNIWGINKLGAQNYQYGLSKKTKVKVGIIDTGIYYTHADLASNVDTTLGYNFVAKTTNALDDHGHGTHVAGIVGGLVNAKGVFGVDSNVTLVPLKVLSADGYGSSYDIVDAINYAANNGIKVINMSLGGTGDPANDIMCNAITAAKAKGTISVVAAGNENANVSTKVPAGCADAITVGAVDSTLTKASFSNYGTKVDVAAPGVNIYSTYLNNAYATMNGTSMATPFMAGLVASMLSYNSSLTTEQVRTILKNTANSDTVNSSVNIGRFANMNKIMSYMGVQNDAYSSTGSVGTGTVGMPVLQLASTKLSTNVYKVIANVTTNGTSIVNYTFKDGTTVLYSGTNNYYQITLTKNTTIAVTIKDNKGQTVSQSVTLTYEAPVVNKVPVVTMSYKTDKRYYSLTLKGTDSDGKIVLTQIYINGALTYNLKTSAKTVSYLISFSKGKTYTVSVKMQDDKGGVGSGSITLK